MPWDAVDHNGQWVEIEDDVVRVVQEIQRLWPELSVKYCENPGLGEAPYLIAERLPDGREVGVMTCLQLDSRLLDVLHQADNSKHDVTAYLDKVNGAARLAQAQRLTTWRDHCRDVIVSAARHIGTSYTFKDTREGHEGELVKITDDPAHRTLGL